MRRSRGVVTAGLCLALVAGVASLAMAMGDGGRHADRPAEQPGQRFGDPFAGVPLSFEPNVGQVDDAVRFLSRGPDFDLFLTPSEAVVRLAGSAGDPASVLRMRPVGAGANPAATMTPGRSLPGTSHYMRAGTLEASSTAVPTFADVRYADVYPGIDLVFHGNGRRLEHDFVVAPGVDPSQILVELDGHRSMGVSPEGELVLDTAGGAVRMAKPVIYQEAGGRRSLVAGRFQVRGDREVGFEVGPY
ncbi:MAG: hypothetical protein ACRD0Q_08690, partial [Acidimicrobiales bacterium]